MRNKIISFIIALFMSVTIIPAVTDTVEAATKITDKSVYYVTGYVGGDCLLTSNIYMMRRAAIMRESTKWKQMNNTSVELRGALCTSKTRYSNCLKNKYTYTFDGLTFKSSSASLKGSASAKKKKLRNLLKEHPEGIAVWASNAGKGYPHAVLLTEYKNGKFYCADSTHNASKYRKKGKNRGVEPFSTCTVSSISRITKYWYLEDVKGVAESKPLQITNNAETGKPVLKWNRVLNAKKYKVQRKLATSDKYSTIATVTSKTFTDKSAVATKKYHYRIKAYNSKGKCIFTGGAKLRTCDLAAPVITDVANIEENGNLKITFKGVTNADKYNIYRASSSKKTYKYLGSVKCEKDSGGELHSYIISSGEVGKKYCYKIKALNTKITGEDSALSKYRTGYRILGRPEIELGIVEDGKVIISWAEIEGADKYDIYRSTMEDGEYELIKSTEEISVVDDTVVAGTTYYYRVVARYNNGEADSAFSVIKSITIVDQDEPEKPETPEDPEIPEDVDKSETN